MCRMLAIAYRDVFLPFQTDANRDEFSAAQLERELTLVALVGIEDPLREEVPAAIEACHRAGISVRMLTGAAAAHRQLLQIALHCGAAMLPGCNAGACIGLVGPQGSTCVHVGGGPDVGSAHSTGDNSTTGSSIAQQCGILPDGCEQLIAADHSDVLAELRSLGPPPGVGASLDSAADPDDSSARSSVGRRAVAHLHLVLHHGCVLS